MADGERSQLGRAFEPTTRRILVAEDDADMRRLLADTLHADGYDVHAVEDGASLLVELARTGRFHHGSVDLVLADVRMPLCSGLQALDTVRGVGIHVPFVLLTAFGGADVHQRAQELGAILLDKPVSMRRLLSVLAAPLDEEQAR